MAIKTISQFDAAMPTSNDKILFEQNGEGKSTTIGNAVNTCSLTYEEIIASTDLTGKVASASAVSKRIVVETKFSVEFSANEYATPYGSLGIINTNINYLDFINVYEEGTPTSFGLINNGGKCTIYVYGNSGLIGQTRILKVRYFKQ